MSASSISSRQFVFCGGFDLAAVLAQFGRNPIEPERAVHFLFGGGGNLRAVFHARQRVLAQCVTALDRALPDGDVVGLRAGEILQRGPERGTRQEAHIHLQPVAQAEADLVLTFREQVGDGRVCGHVVHGSSDHVLFAGRSGEEKVQVAHGLAAAPQGARRGHAFHAGKRRQILSNPLGCRFGGAQQKAPAVLAVFLDAFAQFADLLFAEAGQGSEAALVECCSQFIDGGHAERFPHQGHRFGTHAGQLQQLEHARAITLQQFVAQLQAAAFFNLNNVRGHPLADARDSEQPLGLTAQRGKLHGAAFHRLCRVAVGANPERVAVADFQKIGGLAEQLRNAAIVQVPCLMGSAGQVWRCPRELRDIIAYRLDLHPWRGRMNDRGGDPKKFAAPLLCSFPRAHHLIGLRTFLTLDNVELHIVSLLQALVPVKLDGAVMHENIRAVVAPDEPVALCVVKPLHLALVMRHVRMTSLQAE